MTKYELYQILDENGFEPSDENLEILTEGLEDGSLAIDEDGALYEFLGMGWKAAGVRYAKRGIKADALKKKAAAEADPDKKAKIEAKEKALREKNAKRDESMAGSAHIAKRMKSGIDEVGKNADTVKKVRETTNTASGILNASYDLSDLLDVNDYEVTNENLEILSEGLESGEILVLDASNIKLYEGIDDGRYVIAQLLENNGFKVNENNITVLTEALKNGHVLLEAKATETEEEKKKDDEFDYGAARRQHLAKAHSEETDDDRRAKEKAKKKETKKKIVRGVVKGALAGAAVLGAIGTGQGLAAMNKTKATWQQKANLAVAGGGASSAAGVTAAAMHKKDSDAKKSQEKDDREMAEYLDKEQKSGKKLSDQQEKNLSKAYERTGEAPKKKEKKEKED